MKLSSLSPGLKVYDVGTQKMGNTTMRTVAVWPVVISSIDLEKETVLASWNGNAERTFYKPSWSKWRATEPLLIGGILGSRRLATRAEVAAHKAKKAAERPS